MTEADISMERSPSGISNDVSRNRKGNTDPDKVVVRKYIKSLTKTDDHGIWTGFADMVASHTDQAVMHQELARKSIGAHLYGLFDGGLIEEWIDCRGMKYEDAIRPDISADIAKNMARLHALDLPLRKPAFHYVELLRKMHAGILENFERINSLPDQQVVMIAMHDYASLLNWLEPLLQSHEKRLVFTDRDKHSGNMALLNRETSPCLLYTSPSPRDQRGSRMPSSA